MNILIHVNIRKCICFVDLAKFEIFVLEDKLDPKKIEVILKRVEKLHAGIGVIHLVHTQNFPKNQHFLPLDDAYFYVCVSGGGGVRNVNLSETFAYVLNE